MITEERAIVKAEKIEESSYKLNKNWRLMQLMFSLEERPAITNLKRNSISGLNGITNGIYRNEVRYKNIVITNPLVQNNKIVTQSKGDNVWNKSPAGAIRFPINAAFVAQWLSEQIVSSKSYKVSQLCDKVIKLANINPAISMDGITLVGIKIVISGRILGAEIATSKTFKAGQIPNNTIQVLKDRGFALAKTRSGTIGIKVTYFWKNKD